MSDEPVAIETGSTTRRAMFAGAGAVGAAAVLAACGTDDSGNDPYTGQDADGGAESPPQSEAPDGQEGEAAQLIAAEEVEVGGGAIVNEEVVVTQPADGEWRGFSAICTHQGCVVAEVSDGTINCNCHGSKFSIEDGSVVAAANNGDASQQDPLPAVEVQVADGWIVRA